MFQLAGFATRGDAAFGFVGPDEIKRKATKRGHILSAGAGTVAKKIVLKGYVQKLVHRLDAPVQAGTVSQTIERFLLIIRSRSQRQGRYEVALVTGAVTWIFGAVDDFQEHADILKAQLPRIGLLAFEPVD
jgi:hypothetical protein